MKRLSILAVLAIAWVGLSKADAQQIQTQTGTFGSRTLGNTVGGASANRNAGLTQTGQVTATGAVQRQDGGFVGASSQNMAGIFGSNIGTGGLGRSATGGFGASLGAGIANQFGFGGAGRGQQGGGANLQNQNATQNRGNLRVSMEIGFGRPRSVLNASAASLRLSKRLSNIPQLDTLGPIAVTSVGRTVVLRGTVPSERARDLAERLALLEPGVSEVQNELSVVEPSTLPELPRQ